MAKRKARELLMVTLEKSIDLYLSSLATEGKSPRYVSWLRTRLRFFSSYIRETYSDGFVLQDLSVDDGRDYIKSLLERNHRYANHPMHNPIQGKLQIQYIHGLGRAIRSFSNWPYEEGYIEENVMRRLKLPKLPKTFPEPLTEDDINRVLSVTLNLTNERLRNFSIMMMFLDTGIRLDELVNMRLSRIDFTIGEMTILGKSNKERKVPIGIQAKKALLDYVTKERPDPVNPLDADRVYLTSEGYPLTDDAVEKLFQRIKKTGGIEKFHPHVCRHTFSVRYLVNGGDAFSLQKILGHTSLEMTRKYVNLAEGNVKEKHRRFSPMDNLGFNTKARGRPKLK